MDPQPSADLARIDRRQALRWIGAAAAAALPQVSFSTGLLAQSQAPNAPLRDGAKRIGWDPVLNKVYHPGELWPLSFNTAQRRAASALVDLILPPDHEGDKPPSELGVQDFIDEWVSSPYDETAKDRNVILEGLDWLDAEAQRRFQRVFSELAEIQKCAIADDICGKDEVRAELRNSQHFFSRFRDLAASGYYTTPQGWKDIGYVGNVPTLDFAGPTPEALRHLGLEA